MKVTDYSKIANKYDKNQYRLNIEPDDDLKDYIDRVDSSKYRVLDLACGTGNYLFNQIQYFHHVSIEWHGLDASEDMLNKAKKKVENVSFVQGLAEEMPYSSSYFDFIANNYAFHHFTKKSEVIDEIARVLKKNGIYKMRNIAVHEMPKWWIYQYFPSAYFEDLKRFWQKELIFNEFSNREFDVNIRLEYRMEQVNVADYLGYAENRDISILTLIDDEEYLEGLEKMRFEVNKDPQAKITVDFAELFCVAKKN